MIELQDDTLAFSFPEVHKDATLRIDFQRTLRIPDDNREYPLPPGLGNFPLKHVDDHADKLPSSWLKHGGIFFPMYQAEALWINFSTRQEYPFAVKIAAGKINAVSGERWSDKLNDPPPSGSVPQDYLAIPEQSWLDGFSVGEGTIRQFVAMPLGEGYTAEEQLTNEAEVGGIQIIVYPMKASHYEQLHQQSINNGICNRMPTEFMIGLAPGGLMRQKIYEDPHSIDAWDTSASSRCFVHLVNSQQYKTITSELPPNQPPSALDYTNAGLPWFDLYDAELKAIGGSKKLAGLDSVAAQGVKKGEKPLPENAPLPNVKVTWLSKLKNLVREGEF